MRHSFSAAALLLAAVGCGGEPEQSTEWPVSQQSLTLVRFADDSGTPRWDLGYSYERGWHVARVDPMQARAVAAAQGAQSVDSFFGDLLPEGGVSVGFVASTVTTSSFSASSSGSGGFSAGSAGAGGFSGSAGFSSSFSAGAIPIPGAGGNCDLTPICDFVGVLCDAFAAAAAQSGGSITVDGDCGSAVSECIANISSAQIPAEVQPIVCVLADAFGCVFGQGLAGIDSAEARCSSELAQLEAMGFAVQDSFAP